MSDDRPLTSEEMIRQARKGLESPFVPDLEPDRHLTEPEDEAEAEPEPTTHNTPAATRTSAQRPRRQQRRPTPSDPFARSKPIRKKASGRAFSLLIGVVAVLIGIAIALSAIAGTTQ